MRVAEGIFHDIYSVKNAACVPFVMKQIKCIEKWSYNNVFSPGDLRMELIVTFGVKELIRLFVLFIQ